MLRALKAACRHARMLGHTVPSNEELRMGCAYALTHPWAPLDTALEADSADGRAFAREMHASERLLCGFNRSVDT